MTKQQKTDYKLHTSRIMQLVRADDEAAEALRTEKYAVLTEWLNKTPAAMVGRSKPWKPNGVARMIQAVLGREDRAERHGNEEPMEEAPKTLSRNQLTALVRRLMRETKDTSYTAAELNNSGHPYKGRGGVIKPWTSQIVRDFLRHANRHKLKSGKVLSEPEEVVASTVSNRIERKDASGNMLSCNYTCTGASVEISLQYSGSSSSDEASGLRALLEQLKIYVG